MQSNMVYSLALHITFLIESPPELVGR